MPIPTRAQHRAAFNQALERIHQQSKPTFTQAEHVIRAAVDVVLGDELGDKIRPITARYRASFLALADAIEGND